MPSLNRKRLFLKALRTSLPVMAGYIVLGTGFGVLMQSHGFGLPWVLSMSLLVYAGSMQYVAVNLLSSGASVLTFAVTALLVNARHLFYGISMLDRYRDTGKARPYLIFALTDETYSLLSTDRSPLTPEERKRYYFWVSLLNQSYWVTGSVLGSLLGSVLPFDTRGIDFSLTALFLTLAVDQWHSGKYHLFTGMGFLISAFCLVLFGPDRFLIPAMALIVCSVLLAGKKGGENA